MIYRPHLYQEKFHKSKARYRTLIAGRRGGKTVAGAVECIINICKVTKFKDGDPYGVVIAPTYQMLNDITVPELLKWGAPYIKQFNKADMVMHFKNGFPLLLRSADKPDRLRGLKLAWGWGDEVSFWDKGRLVWETLEPALTDYKGNFWVTTSPQGRDWVYQTFWIPAEQKDPYYDAWRYKTVDNPFIDSEEVERKRNTKDPKLFRQEYEATFEEFVGQIYPIFSPTKHVIDPFSIPPYWRRVKGMDMGFAPDPFAAVWLAISPEGVYYLYQEYEEANRTISENGKAILGIEDSRDMYFAIGHDAYARDPRTGETKAKDLEDIGIAVKAATNDVQQGIDRIYNLLSTNRLYIFSNCQKTINDLLSYSWDVSSVGEIKPKPKARDDHLPDALRYACMEYWDERVEHVEPRKVDVLKELSEARQSMLAKRALNLGEESFGPPSEPTDFNALQ